MAQLKDLLVNGETKLLSTGYVSTLLPRDDQSYNLGSRPNEFLNTYSRKVNVRHLDASGNYANDKNLYIGYGSSTPTENIYFYYSTGTLDSPASSRRLQMYISNSYIGFCQNVIPGSNNTYNIGQSGNIFNSIYATNFVGNASTSTMPLGFSRTSDNATWGITTGSTIIDWGDSTGGDIDFRRDCPISGQTSIKVDGRFYQNEGQYMCLDTNNYSGYALPLSGGTLTGDLYTHNIRPTADMAYTNGSSLAEWSRLHSRTVYCRHIDSSVPYGSAAGGNYELFLGYGNNQPTTCTRFYNSSGSWGNVTSRTEQMIVNKYGVRVNNWLGIGGQDNNYRLWVNGTTRLSDSVYFDNGTHEIRFLCADNDYCRFLASSTDSNAGYLEIATADDGTEPIYVRQYTGVYSSITRTLTLLDSSGNTQFCGNVYWGQSGTGANYLNGSASNGGMNSVLIGDDVWLGDCNNGGILALKANNSTQAGIRMYGQDGTYYGTVYANSNGVYASPKIYGAVWNDYAEFRNQKEEISAGYCVTCANDGKVFKTTERLQTFEGITSDTYGFAIGETDDCKTPLAAAGRVLVYTYEPREEFNQGDCVCAGPQGKVSKMTREEILAYPDRIVGIVSEIPEYTNWGQDNVDVDGRIWIKVR